MKRVIVAFMTFVVMGCLTSTTAFAAGGPGPDCTGYDRPLVGTDSYVLEEGSSLSVPAPGVLVNDQSQQDPPQELSFQSVTYSTPYYDFYQTRWVNGSPDGGFVFTPPADFSGLITYYYSVADQVNPDCPGFGLINITVTPTQDPPVAVDDSLIVSEDMPATANVVANDTDLDADQLQVADVQGGQNGTCAVVNNQVRYTPNPNYNSTDSCTVTISDGHGNTDTSTLSITINPVNDPPKANFTVIGSVLSASADGSSSYDVDGDPFTYTWNFSDGTGYQSGGATISHQFRLPGNYTVILTVTEPSGASDTLRQSVAACQRHRWAL